MNRLVLIADGNLGRRQKLAEACATAGIPCKVAPHGAAALELALGLKPDLIVAEWDLPLVDALKLSDILRANPRTRECRFLFLGDDRPPSQRRGLGDLTVPGSLRTDEVIRTIEDLLAKREQIDHLDQRTSAGGDGEGELSQLPLADLIQLFHLGSRSGRLDLRRERDDGTVQSGEIVLQDGDVVAAEVDCVQGVKALFRLLAWREGHFAFTPGETGEPTKILTPTRTLLVEGLRQIDEWDRLSLELPPVDSEARLRVKSSALPNIVHPLTQEVLLLLELYPRVGDVVDQCSFPDYQVLRTLHTLAQRGIVEIGQARAVPLASATDGPFNEAQARRLREWTQASGARDGRRVSAKLLVVAPDPAAVPDFANLLRHVPGARLAPELMHGRLGALDLGALGWVHVDDEVGIELLHVPSDERFAPLWPRVGHGALGVLFLLAGPVAQSMSQVRIVQGVAARLPGLKNIHVTLLPKGERVSPDDLQEHLSVIDEASMFLLPLESGRAPTALMRSLFSRIVS